MTVIYNATLPLFVMQKTPEKRKLMPCLSKGREFVFSWVPVVALWLYWWLLGGGPPQLQDRTCLIFSHQPLSVHIEFQNSDKLSCGKNDKVIYAQFLLERRNARAVSLESWEQMSYSSWGSSIRLSFPISSHHWQPRFTGWRMGRGPRFGARWIGTIILSTSLI